MKKHTHALSVRERRALFFERRRARARANFDRDLAANTAPIADISANGAFVCNTHATIGVAPPPPASKWVSDSRGKWHFPK